MGIALLFILSLYFDLMIQVVDYSKYFRFFILGLCHLMLRILHQIHIVYNSKLGSSQPSFHAFNCISEPSLQDVHPSSPVAISLPAFGFCHLATTLTIQWRSWHLHKGRRPIASNRLLNLITYRVAQRW